MLLLYYCFNVVSWNLPYGASRIYSRPRSPWCCFYVVWVLLWVALLVLCCSCSWCVSVLFLLLYYCVSDVYYIHMIQHTDRLVITSMVRVRDVATVLCECCFGLLVLCCCCSWCVSDHMTHHTERFVSTSVLGVRDVGQRAGHYFVLAFDFFPRLKKMFLLILCFFFKFKISLQRCAMNIIKYRAQLLGPDTINKCLIAFD